ncbi:udp-N-acetylglucosamine 4-epimerase [Salmonella bongori]|nr:udp-N-acetylglucosamine 4-epimerase [Salmonella bongori]
MAYVGNIVEFIKFKLKNVTAGYEVYNYVDKPDLNMNQLVAEVEQSLGKKIPSIHLPYSLGMMGGYCFRYPEQSDGQEVRCEFSSC